MRPLIVILMGLMLISVAAPARAETMLVVANKAVPPKSWLDGDTPRGIAVDVARAVLTRAGFEVKVELYPFQRALDLTKAGEAILTGTFHTADRAAFLEFSEPMFQDEVLLVVSKGNEFPFEKPADLAGKRIGAQDGTTYGTAFQEASALFSRDNDNDPAARIRKLMAGRVDAIILNPGLGAVTMHAKNAGVDLSELTVLPTPVDRPNIHMAMAKGPTSAETMARINEAIRDLKADGTIAGIVKSYN